MPPDQGNNPPMILTWRHEPPRQSTTPKFQTFGKAALVGAVPPSLASLLVFDRLRQQFTGVFEPEQPG